MPLYANHFTFWREESINSVIRAPVARACVSSFPIMSEREVVYIDYVVDVLDIGAEVIIDEGDANGTNDLSNQGDTDTGMQQKFPMCAFLSMLHVSRGHALISEKWPALIFELKGMPL